MKITVKVRFNTSKEKVEKFGRGMYLVYLSGSEGQGTPSTIADLLSKDLVVPPARIEFAGVDSNKNWVFELV